MHKDLLCDVTVAGSCKQRGNCVHFWPDHSAGIYHACYLIPLASPVGGISCSIFFSPRTQVQSCQSAYSAVAGMWFSTPNSPRRVEGNFVNGLPGYFTHAPHTRAGWGWSNDSCSCETIPTQALLKCEVIVSLHQSSATPAVTMATQLATRLVALPQQVNCYPIPMLLVSYMVTSVIPRWDWTDDQLLPPSTCAPP